jgi:hypothetical protein
MRLATPKQLEKMRQLGMTRADAEHWRNFYMDVHLKSVGRNAETPEFYNPSALSRATLFQYYMNNL